MSEENQNVDEVVEEELEVNDEQDESRTDEEESGEESEVEDGSDAEGDDEGGESERDPRGERQERAKAQIDRLKEENKRLKAEKAKRQEDGQESVAPNSELVERTYLAANGLKDREIQDEVIRLAHKFDISVDEAMDDADIAGRAETLIKQKKAQKSVASGTGGAAVRTKGVNYYTAYFQKNGDFPAGVSNEMIAKVTDKLAER